MIHFTCDLCDKLLLLDEDVRYRVRIEVYAAYDVMELTEENLQQDHEKEISNLCRELADIDQDELQDGVYKEMEFDLCPACQKRYIQDPLFRTRPRIRFTENQN